MGCDIHLHVEIRYNGKWEHYAYPNVDRWYELFGIMAGVRSNESPIVEPKGFPNDASITTRLSYEDYGRDAHTPSWLNEEEIDKLSAWLKSKESENKPQNKNSNFMAYDLEYGIFKGTYMFGHSLTAFKHYNDTQYLPDGCDSVRFVFWFDN